MHNSALITRHSALRLGIALMLAALLFLVTAAPASAATFSDLQGNWSYQAVTRVATLDLISGYPSGQFMPDQPVSLLESIVLLLKACGYNPSSGQNTGQAASPASGVPQVPWGQPYVNAAVAKNIIPDDVLGAFNPDAPATRAEIAVMLGRLLQLPVSESSAPGSSVSDSFSDLSTAPAADIPYITAIHAAGLMQGYSDGSFGPQKSITRAEMAALLARMIDLDWAGLPAGRRAVGWLRALSSGKGAQSTQNIELVSLQGAKGITMSPSLTCFSEGEETTLPGIMGARVEVLFDDTSQAACISVLSASPQAATEETVRGSVKAVALGVDSYLVMIDLQCNQRILPLAWNAVVSSNSAQKTTGFQTLKVGAFIDAFLAGGEVTEVAPLATKKVSGIITNFYEGQLTLNVQVSQNQPGSFNPWDTARVVDNNGQHLGGVSVGDSVQITYLNPVPGETSGQIPLEIVDLSQ